MAMAIAEIKNQNAGDKYQLSLFSLDMLLFSSLAMIA